MLSLKIADLGFIQVPDMDEDDFEEAPLFDTNDAPEEMIEDALYAVVATAVALAVI